MTKPRQGPLMPGEPVQLTDPKGRTHLITLRAGASFHTHRGTLSHDDMIGGPDGNVIRSQGGTLEPAFGRPSALKEPHVTPDGRRVAVTADVLDDLVGVPRTAIYTAEHGTLRRVSAGTGSARSPRFSPDGRQLAFLADRAQAGVFQLHLLDGGFGEAVAAPRGARHGRIPLLVARWPPPAAGCGRSGRRAVRRPGFRA